MIFVFRRAIDWRHWQATVLVNILSGSINNGASVLLGPGEELKMLKSATIMDDASERLSNPTPGEILAEDFLKPLGMSQTKLGVAIGVSPRRINEIVLGKRSVTADTSLRLARYFGLSDGYWLRLQNAYDLDEQRAKIGPALDAIVRRAA
jgi:antitoxin HigA-1